MTEIRLTNEMNHEEWEVLARESQNINQFDDYSATLYRDNESGKLYYLEDLMSDYNLYVLDENDINEIDNEDYGSYLYDQVSEWIGSEDDILLASIRWEHTNPEDEQVDDDFDGECKVLVSAVYFGYEPIDWAHDDDYNALTFDNAKEAREWIDEQEEGTYYLSHNEAGRPAYYIIEA